MAVRERRQPQPQRPQSTDPLAAAGQRASTARRTSASAQTSALSSQATTFLVASLVLFTAFALTRAAPLNTNLAENGYHALGDNDRRIGEVFHIAQERAARPFFEVRNHGLHFDRNPALYQFVAELFVRAGVTSTLPLQILSVVLWNVGLCFCFLWLRNVFDSELAAAVGVGFLLTTPFLLFHSSAIDSEPYTFTFLHLTLYSFSRYLKEDTEADKRRWLIRTCITYFLVCTNYWMYHMSTFLMMVALQVKARRFSIRLCCVLALPAVAATLAMIVQVAYARGGVGAGVHWLADIAAARTGDWRIQGAQWYPTKTFLTPKRLDEYPATVAQRIRVMSGVPVTVFASLVLSTLVMAGREAWVRHRWLIVVLLAALSWNLVMVQHTVLHGFTGMYSFLGWVVAVSAFTVELYSAFTPPRAAWAFAALAIPLFAYGLNRTYLPNLLRYTDNIVAGKVVSSGAVGQSTRARVPLPRAPR